MKGVNLFKKVVSMTKKRSSEIFKNRRGFFQKFLRMLSENISSQNVCPPPNICDPNFCPPIFMTSLRRCLAPSLGGQKIVRGPNFRMTFFREKIQV